MKVPFMDLKAGLSEIYDEIINKIECLIKTANFIGGEEIELFEQEFANYCNTKYAVGCSNGTDALVLALKVLGIKSGDTVLVPVNSFIATSEAVSAVGANVEFVDIEKDYYTIDPRELKKVIENNQFKNIKAIIVVHLFGQMANMPEIMRIAKDNNLNIIEDSAQAHGASLFGKKPGEYGDIATFSFYPGKNLGAFGDAGAVITNKIEHYQNIKMLVNHGRWKKKYEHEIEGYNKRLDTIQAAILRIKLKHLKRWTEMKTEKAKLYFRHLQNKNVILPKIRKDSSPVWHIFALRVQERDKIQKMLKDNGISTGIHYPIPLHLQPAYKYKGYKEGDFPVSEKYAKELLSLPLWPEISEEQIDFVSRYL